MYNKMKDIKNSFKSAQEQASPSDALLKFNTLRIMNPTSNYVFVEGSSDETFYSASNVPGLRDGVYIFNVKEESDTKKEVGKEGVLHCYDQVKKAKNIGSSFKRCIFIIDRDYDPELLHTEVSLSKDDKDRLSMTYGHSFENYFLEKNNLKKLFSYYTLRNSLSENDYKEYMEHFSQFANMASRYFAAKPTITHFYKADRQARSKYEEGYGIDSIFNNNIHVNEGIDIHKLQYELGNMMTYIRNNRHEEYYEKIKEEIGNDPELYIRGHNCYNHLERYLADKLRVFLKGDYHSLIRKFTISFNGYSPRAKIK